MKRILLQVFVTILSMIILFTIFCGCKKEEQVIIPQGYTKFKISETNGVKTEGYGVQIDTHIYKAYNAMTEDELNEFYKRVVDMNVQTIRTQVFPEWFERGNDNSDYDYFDYASNTVDMQSIEMQQLFQLLDFCEQNSITVDLSVYGCCATYESQDGKIHGSWLGAPFTSNWITSPKKRDENGNPFNGADEFAESVYALIHYVLKEKEYTCVTEFSIYPEPNLSFIGEDGRMNYGDYVNLVEKVHKKLERENLRDKIKFSGPAVALQTAMGLTSYIKDLDAYFDKYTISSYSYDDKDENSILSSYGSALKSLVADTGKSFSLAEFGSKNVIDSANQTDIDTYDRAMFLARYMINLANQGCAGMKYWEVCDMMYGGFMMNLGLWRFRNKNWEARPQYYTWSLITKYTEIGSEIYPILQDGAEDEQLVSVAFKLPNGKWSYMVCNTSDTVKKVSFVNTNKSSPSKMNVYEVRASKCDGTCVPIASEESIQKVSGAVNIKVMANSFVVLSEL